MGTLDLSILSAYLCAYAFGARCFGHVCACTLLFMCIIVLSVNAFVRHAYSSLCVCVYRRLCLHYCVKFYYHIVSFGVWPAGSHSNTQASLGEARSWMLYWIRESMIPTLLLPLGAQGLSGCHSNHLWFRLALCSIYIGYPFKFLFWSKAEAPGNLHCWWSSEWLSTNFLTFPWFEQSALNDTRSCSPWVPGW